MPTVLYMSNGLICGYITGDGWQSLLLMNVMIPVCLPSCDVNKMQWPQLQLLRWWDKALFPSNSAGEVLQLPYKFVYTTGIHFYLQTKEVSRHTSCEICCNPLKFIFYTILMSIIWQLPYCLKSWPVHLFLFSNFSPCPLNETDVYYL